jgi:hypothetical protein
MDVGRDSSRRLGSPYSFSHWPALGKYEVLDGHHIHHFTGKSVKRYMQPASFFAYDNDV